MLQAIIDWFGALYRAFLGFVDWLFELVGNLLSALADVVADMVWSGFELLSSWLLALFNSVGSDTLDVSSVWASLPASVIGFLWHAGMVEAVSMVVTAAGFSLTIKAIRFVRGMLPL